MKKYAALKIILILLFFIPKTTYAQDPELTATGDQTYCPGTNFLNIAESAAITNLFDPSITETSAPVTVQIASGYESGKDVLTYVGTNPAITATAFDVLQGNLTLSPTTVGVPVSYTDLAVAIENIQFSTTSTTVGKKEFTILLSDRLLSYLPRNGHYYEYVSQPSVRWSEANTGANGRTYYGMQGYLATITKADEQKIAGEQAPGTGWIGARSLNSDTATADWRWITGPEGAANGGTGTSFFLGRSPFGTEVSTGVDGKYSNWGSGEPNGANGTVEYAQIIHPDLAGGNLGVWNDLNGDNNIGGGSLLYIAAGYIVEYGDMLGDNPIDPPLAITTIRIPDALIYPDRPPTICPSETFTYRGYPVNGGTTTQVFWYDDPISDISIGVGNDFPASHLVNTTTTFYSDNGCSSASNPRKSFTVTVNPGTLPTFDAIPDICENDTAPVLPTTSTNGIDGSWSPANVSNTTTGTYTFTPNPGQCASQASLTVTVNPGTLPTFDAIPDICENDTAPILPTTSTNGIDGSWSPATVSNTATGTYTFTPDAGLCASTASITVTVGSDILPTFDAIAAICENDTAPVLPITSTNGIDGSWSPATVSNTATGTYTFTPNVGGCATTATITITVNSRILPTFNAIPAICINDTAPVLPTTSTNGIDGSWSPATVSNTATGTYTFTPDAGQCAETASLTVTVNSRILPTFDAIAAICENDTAPVLPTMSTNNVNGSWSPATVSNTATGTYTFTPNVGECATTASLTVTVNSRVLPTFDAIPNICENDTAPVLPTTSTNGIDGSWSPATVSNTATGTYTFTPDAGECATTASLAVTVNSRILPNFDAIPAICENDTAPVLPTMSINGINGSWSPATVSNTATGTYTFTPNAGLCATTASLTVTVNSSILPTFNAIPDICVNDTAPVLPTTSSNGFSGTWSPTTVSNTVTGTYTFTPDTVGTCVTTTSLTVTVNQETLPTFDAIAAICENDTAPVLPTMSTNNINGSWSPATVSNTTTGTYTFTPDAGQCAETASLTVTVNSRILPTFDAIPAICENDTAPVLPTTSTNGIDGSWSPATVSNTATGTYTFTPNVGECATTASLVVTVNSRILPTFDAIPAICENDTAPVLPTMSTNGFSGTWSPATVSNTATGTYTFTPNAGLCATTALLTVTINPLPNIDLNLDGSADEVVCSDITSISFTLDAGIQDNTPTSDYTYVWSKDGSILPDTTPTLDVSEIGVYTVNVTNATTGCSSQIRTITIKTSNSPIIDTIEIVELTSNNSVTVNLEAPGDFQYTIDNPNGFWQDENVFFNVSGGEHTIYVSDKYGCPGDSRVVNVISAQKFFTPNNDGDNDYWKVKGLNDNDSQSVIYIYNRYGKLLKQWGPSFNKQGWDGTFNGALLPADDYWYILKLEDGREAKGHFSLVR